MHVAEAEDVRLRTVQLQIRVDFFCPLQSVIHQPINGLVHSDADTLLLDQFLDARLEVSKLALIKLSSLSTQFLALSKAFCDAVKFYDDIPQLFVNAVGFVILVKASPVVSFTVQLVHLGVMLLEQLLCTVQNILCDLPRMCLVLSHGFERITANQSNQT